MAANAKANAKVNLNQPVIFINKKSKKIFAELFGGNVWKHYLCIRFPKGTASKIDL